MIRCVEFKAGKFQIGIDAHSGIGEEKDGCGMAVFFVLFPLPDKTAAVPSGLYQRLFQDAFEVLLQIEQRLAAEKR